MNLMENFQVKPIKNEIEYKESFKKLDEVWAAKPNTPEGDTLELLLMVIEKYEAAHYPMPKLDPIEAIKYKMEENSLTQKDLVKYFGTKSRRGSIWSNLNIRNHNHNFASLSCY